MIRPKKAANRTMLVKTKVYFIRTKNDNKVKIGIARKIKTRFGNIQSSNYEELVLMGYIYGGRILEKEIHQKFEKHRIRGEWFKLTKKVEREINILLGKEKERTSAPLRKCKICSKTLSTFNSKDTCFHHDY